MIPSLRERKRQTQSHLKVALCLALALSGCGEDAEKKPFTLPTTSGINDAIDQDRDGWHDDVEYDIGTDPEFASEPCVSKTYTSQADAPQRILDFVFIVDNSGSMSEEMPRVREDLRQGFLQTLATTDIDYKVLLLTRFTSLWCAPDAPSCSGPEQTATFVHDDVNVQSRDSMQVLMQRAEITESDSSSYKGWREWLRPQAQKVFVEISDDNSAMDPATFERLIKLIAPEHLFDAQGGRRYTWHSIVGLDYDNEEGGLSASRPLVEEACESAPNAGRQHQLLSILTGGLRFSICGRVDYEEIFTRVLDVSDGGAIPCRFAMPRPSNSPQRRTSTEDVGLQLVDPLENGLITPLMRVRSLDQCAPNAYTTTRSAEDSVVVLCPELCADIRQKPGVVLRAGAACERPCLSSTTGC